METNNGREPEEQKKAGGLGAAISLVGRPLGFLFRLLFGQLRWTPPGWASGSARAVKNLTVRQSRKTRAWQKANPRRFLGVIAGSLVAIVLLTWLGPRLYHWYANRPQPEMRTLTVHGPELTVLHEKEPPTIHPVTIDFDGSVVTLKDDLKPVKAGIRVSPPVAGVWAWTSDRQLKFTPAEDWPVDQEYTVHLDKSLFADHVRLDRYRAEFKTASFRAMIGGAEFYQNPLNPKEKKVVVTLTFSHPVDPKGLEGKVSFTLVDLEKKSLFGKKSRTIPFKVTFGKQNSEAYLSSENITIPERDSEAKVEVAKGVRAARGGNASQELSTSVRIPGMYTFFRVNEARITLVPNERFESDQVLSLEFSTDVDEKELKKNLQLLLLPEDRPAENGVPEKKKYEWSSASEVTQKVLELSTPVKMELIPNERDSSSLYNFKINVPVRKHLYLAINKGTKSIGDYLLYTPYSAVLEIPDFPKELRIMHQGSILSFHGEKKLSVLSRSMPGIKFEIGRVLPGEINHLITQSSGRFDKPDFYGSFGPDNLTEVFADIRALEGMDSGRNQYTGFDLGKYLSLGQKAENRHGLFFVRVSGYDPEKKESHGHPDSRFILITDLGVIRKSDQDHSQDVFVQSVSDGKPVAGARVELLGRNGLPILAETTDARGHAHFPPVNDFEREKEPTVFVVHKGSDISFLPFGLRDRGLNFSRFDVGGVNTNNTEKLNAFLFSERGLYRPGDEFHVGMIVRSQDWKQALDGVPLEATITDPRGVQIHKEKFQLQKEGFAEVSYHTEETSPTGQYEISLYVLKDKDERSLLGSTQIRVEEFLPDTMKISALFTGIPAGKKKDGWVSPEGLKADVVLTNLFGTAAEDHRVAAEMSLTPNFPVFRKYKDYHFHDPLQTKKQFQERLPDQQTSIEGKAQFDLDLARFESGIYQLHFLAQGYAKEGGRSVSADSSTLVSPLKHLVGYKADGDLNYIKLNAKREVRFIAINPSLEMIKLDNIKAKLIETRTVSVLTKQSSGLFKYESVRKEIPVWDKPLTIKKDGLSYALPTDKPGSFVLSLHSEGDADKKLLEVNFDVIGQTNLRQKLDNNAELQIKLKKPDFAPGEDIELQITAPYTGAGLITIEREKVYAFQWFKASTTNSIQKIRVPEGLEGGAYVNVAFVRGLDSREIFTSPLSYGVAPFSVSRERRTNAVELTVPELIKPGDALKIGYQAKKKSKIAIFAVDEGILQVAGYKLPDPLSYFFRKRALEVDTSQLLDLILPEYSIAQSVSASGGDSSDDALGKNLNPFKRKRERPVVFWSGIIDAGPEPGELKYVVPDYFNGSIRVMAVSVSADSIGTAESKTTVRGDFVIMPNVPTFASPGDEIDIGVSVTNSAEGSGEDAEVQLVLKTSEHFQVVSEAVQKLKISEGREKGTNFRIKAQKMLGSGTLTFTASHGNKKSKHDIDLSVRPASPYVTQLQTGIIRKDSKEFELKRKMYSELQDTSIAFSIVPLALSKGLMKYLDMYPYGCTEQLVSKAMPAIILKSRPDFGILPEKAEKGLKDIVLLLRSRQNAEGAFGVWSANSMASNFYTVYAYHFMTEARDRGFSVPKEMFGRVEAYLGGLLMQNPGTLADARVQAYALYVLARNGIMANNELIAIRKVLEAKWPADWPTDLTGIYLAATYGLYRQDAEAQRLIGKSKLGDSVESDYGNYYDSLNRDTQYLYIISKHFPDLLKKVTAEQLDSIIKPVADGHYNTISSAYTILALDSYLGVPGNTNYSEFVKLSEVQSGKAWEDLPLPVGLFPQVKVGEGMSRLKVENHADKSLYYQVIQAGFDLDLPTKDMKERLEVFREIRDGQNKAVAKAKLGSEYMVHLKLRATGYSVIPNVAVVDLLPSGFEVVYQRNRPEKAVDGSDGESEDGDAPVVRPAEDSPEGEAGDDYDRPTPPEDESEARNGPGYEKLFYSLLGIRDARADSISDRLAGSEASTFIPEYTDIREDRVVLYGNVGSSAMEFTYKVKAINKGKFIIPPPYAESMYDRTVRARGLGGTIEVEGP